MSAVLGMVAVLALSACQSAPPPQPPHYYHVRPTLPKERQDEKRDRVKLDDQLRLLQQELRGLQFRTRPSTTVAGETE
jgi:hypothetical protein